LIESGVERKKRKKVPKSDENQKVRQKKCLQKLRRGLFKPSSDVEIIIDDESYFSLDGSDSYGNDFYYSHELMETPEEVKYKFVKKSPKKVMVWLAMSSRGISQPFIIKSPNAINAEIYVKECIKKRSVKFISKYHSDGNFIFWPDLASCHYARSTLSAFRDLNIEVVPKDSNPPNVPQLRPIEKFWANLKRNVYKNGWRGEKIEDLIVKIKKELKKLPPEICQNYLRTLKTKVRKAADNGVLSVIN
jgi:hypothetical protein